MAKQKTGPAIQIAVSYSNVSDKDLAVQALAAYNGVKGDPGDFLNAPGLEELGTTLQLFQAALAMVEQDGGKKAIAEKNKLRKALIKLLRPLGHYVEANCKDDPTIVNNAGF